MSRTPKRRLRRKLIGDHRGSGAIIDFGNPRSQGEGPSSTLGVRAAISGQPLPCSDSGVPRHARENQWLLVRSR